MKYQKYLANMIKEAGDLWVPATFENPIWVYHDIK